ncbi:hypothetical protein ACFVT2_00480 [Streptomyces sp. NPDC058000]|uniref:hypothetical protein n=1 Tax=Streptomyces sp. NPDC058000 TaxID=3346299 RepID=UPI0036ED6C3C
MPSAQPSVLYVTDLTYEARGRRYGDEDVFLSSRLRDTFTVALCHPLDAVALMDSFDAVVVRNSGPVLNYQAAYEDFRTRALSHGVRVYNPLTGKADMAGKQYLLDLSAAGHPVIPTADRRDTLDRLPHADAYVAKPKAGADSLGLRVLARDELDGLDGLDSGDLLIQPRIDFRYEVSFYFVDHTFQYALRTPDSDRRWALTPYRPTDDDLAFAQCFVDWNALDHGIQRVDACRTQDGRLLLVELEDLNPYLSLDRLAPDDRDAFVTALKTSLLRFAQPH